MNIPKYAARSDANQMAEEIHPHLREFVDDREAPIRTGDSHAKQMYAELMETEFKECSSCASKLGDIYLCESCLHNSRLVQLLKEKLSESNPIKEKRTGNIINHYPKYQPTENNPDQRTGHFDISWMGGNAEFLKNREAMNKSKDIWYGVLK